MNGIFVLWVDVDLLLLVRPTVKVRRHSCDRTVIEPERSTARDFHPAKSQLTRLARDSLSR